MPPGGSAYFPDDLIARCGPIGRVLEIGVGAGFDAVRFCKRSADYVGIDVLPLAVEITTDRLRALGCEASIKRADLHNFEDRTPFDLVFDRGAFHNQKSEEAREAFVRKCAELLQTGGHWISVVGSADHSTASAHGAFYLSNFVPVVERYFEVLALDRRPYGPEDWPDNFDAWHCLFRKRQAAT